MKQPAKSTIQVALCTISASFITGASTFAKDPPKDICSSSASAEIKASAGCGSGADTQLPDTITGILNGVIAVAGLVAAVYIVVGGVQYMTSAGDAGKIKKAKETILYALIGLIICALTFAIVNFVLANILS